LIIGDGELAQELKRYASELQVENLVVFSGWRKDMPSLYKSLDVVALTSLNEGTPVTLIEAMAAGKPVIATDVGGVKDLLGPIDTRTRGAITWPGGAFWSLQATEKPLPARSCLPWNAGPPSIP
jgi:glycosyltransferase involved in cell wall biosynthesis